MTTEFQYDVFLSHNQADKPRVRQLAQRLRAAGLRVWFDEWVIQPGDDIYLTIERGLEASRTLVLCLSPAALGSDWVGLERSTVLFRDPANARRRFIPLLLAECKLPDALRRYKYVDFREEIDATFAELLAAFQSEAGPTPLPMPCPPAVPSPGISSTAASEDHSDSRFATERLPESGDCFVGREAELKKLDDALADPNCRIVVLHGPGGIGKTALVAQWRDRLRSRRWYPSSPLLAAEVTSPQLRLAGAFAFKFDDPKHADLLPAPDAFANTFLSHFKLSPSPDVWTRFPNVLCREGRDRFVLILDALQVAQDMAGRIGHDQLALALKSLAGGIEENRDSLCVITSQIKITDFGRNSTTVRQIPVEPLHKDAKAELLYRSGVTHFGYHQILDARAAAADEEFVEAIGDLPGHPAILTWVAARLAKGHQGDVKMARQIPFVARGEDDALVVLAKSQLLWLERFAGKSQLCLGVLRSLALFPSSCDRPRLDHVMKDPQRGFFGGVCYVSEPEWNESLSELIELRLVEKWGNDCFCLPLYLSEHLRRQLSDANASNSSREAWVAAQHSLGVFCVQDAEGEVPRSKSQRQRLLQAVLHFCLAGELQRAFLLYSAKLAWKGEHPPETPEEWAQSRATLRWFYSDSFPELICCDQPNGLTLPQKAEIHYEMGVIFRHLGRLRDPNGAATFFDKAREFFESQQPPQISRAAECYVHLTEVALLSGRLKEGADFGKAAESLDKELGDDKRLRVAWRTAYGHILHQQDRLDAAAKLFRDAEGLLEGSELWGMHGFRALNLDLDEVERAAWRKFLGVPKLADDYETRFRLRERLSNEESLCIKILPVAQAEAALKKGAVSQNELDTLIGQCKEVRARAKKMKDQNTGSSHRKLASSLDDPLDSELLDLSEGRAALYQAILRHPQGNPVQGDRDFDTAKRLMEGYDAAVRPSRSPSHLARACVCRSWLACLEERIVFHASGGEGTKKMLNEADTVASNSDMKFFLIEIPLFRGRLLRQDTELCTAEKIIRELRFWRRCEELLDAWVALKGWPGNHLAGASAGGAPTSGGQILQQPASPSAAGS